MHYVCLFNFFMIDKINVAYTIWEGEEYDINDLLEYVGMIFYPNILASFLYRFSYYLV